MALFIMLINNVRLPGEMCCRGDFSPPRSLPWISAGAEGATSSNEAAVRSALLPSPAGIGRGQSSLSTLSSQVLSTSTGVRHPLPPVLVALASAAALSDPFPLLCSSLGSAGPCPPELLLFLRPGAWHGDSQEMWIYLAI